jgi:hypothetical protein
MSNSLQPSPSSHGLNTVIDLTSPDVLLDAARLPSAEIITIVEDDFFPENELFLESKYSARKRRRFKDGRFESSDDNVDDDSIELFVSKVIPPRSELQVLDVFPDADLPAVVELLATYDNHVATVLQHMAEHSYKKSETKVNLSSNFNNGHTVVHMHNGTVWKYDYASTESFVPTPTYVKQATQLLLCDFSFLSTRGAAICMKQCQNHYAVCHNKLLTAVKGAGSEDEQYERVLAVFQGKPLKPDQTARIQSLLVGSASRSSSPTTLKQSRKRNIKPLVTHEILQDELRYVGGRVREWMEAQQTRRDREKKKHRSQRDGTAVECSCCFDTYPIDDMVSCRDEGHLFCMDCLKSFTENLVFGNGNLGFDKNTKQPALELKCFHGDGCSSGFHRACLKKALPPKSLQKYDEVQFQVSIERAGLSANVCSCPKCGFQADVPKEQKIFQCPVAECGYASCRECGEAAHIPLRYVRRLLMDDVVVSQLLTPCDPPAATKLKRKRKPRDGWL